MLQDRVNNQLTVMLGVAEMRHRDLTADGREDLEIAITAARTVAHELDSLSLESLRSWERRLPEPDALARSRLCHGSGHFAVGPGRRPTARALEGLSAATPFRSRKPLINNSFQ